MDLSLYICKDYSVCTYVDCSLAVRKVFLSLCGLVCTLYNLYSRCDAFSRCMKYSASIWTVIQYILV